MSFLFTGKERDAETGLDYFGARYFSGAQGRFTSPDAPFADQHVGDPQSWNLYGYVRNNPLVNIDPTGQDCIYTNTFDEQAGTVMVERGSCSQKGGTYVAGTIDSITYDPNSRSLDYGYSAYEGAIASVGSTNLPNPDPGIEALRSGTQLAEPGVNIAGAGLALFMGGAFGLQAAPAIAAGGRAILAAAATQAHNPVLKDIVNRLYQPQDRIAGGTAGAVRDHFAKGEWLSNSGHLTKAQQRITQLKRLIDSGTLSASDAAIAKGILADLKNAIGRR